MRSYTPDPDATVVPTEGLDMACLKWGDEGPLVVMVHGFPDTARTWDLVGPRVAAEGFRVVAPFTRGYAPTPVPEDGKYDSDTLGMDLIHLIEALGEEKAILVGHDWGASGVYSATGLRPDRVEKMVTVAIPHPATIKPRASTLWGARHFVSFKLPGAAKRFAKNDFAQIRTMYERWSPGFEWPDSEFEHVKNSYSAPGCMDAAIGYYKALTPSAPPGHRARIAVPSLIVGGKQDGVATESDFEASRRRFTGPISIEMVPGGHFLHREYPDPFLSVLLPFLKS